MTSTSSLPIRLLTPRLSAVLFILLFMSVLSVGPRMLNIDGDLPRHLLMGRIVLETGFAPTEEIFSYAYEGRPYTPHEWLAGVIYYVAYLIFGLNGVVLLASILIAATFLLLYSESAAENSQYFLTFLLILFGALVTSIHWITRPHLFTMLFLALWLILIDRLHRGIQVRIWIFPALMLFLANIHAEFIAGFLVLVAYIAGCAWRYVFYREDKALNTGKKMVSIAFLCFAASALNPVGLRTWDIVIGYVNNRYLLSRIAETRPPDFLQAAYWPLLALLSTAIILSVSRRDKFSPPHFFLLVGFGMMSLLSARNAHLAGLVFPFVLAKALVGATGFRPLARIETVIQQMDNQANGRIWPLLMILLAVLLMNGPMGKKNRYEPSIFPVDAVTWLQENPQRGRMFNAFDWGGYVLFHLWPEQKVFIESQTDVTGEVTRKYEAVITLQDGWQDIFNEYEITWAILPPKWTLTKELESQGWEVLYHDGTAVILAQE